jgi:DNA-binding transcriptional LysR family regulator
MAPPTDDEDFASLFAASEQCRPRERRIAAGDVVRGRVIAVGATSAFVAVGGKAEAAIDVSEFRDPQTGLPFAWGFAQDGEEFDVAVRGRITTDDPSTAIEACVAGQGIFQSLELGLDHWLERGELVRILVDWSDEIYPLYAYHPSRHLPPVKVRAFLNFVQEIADGDR